MSEAPILLEKNSKEEPALVLKFGDPTDLNHLKVREILETIGFPMDLFGKLLKLEFEPLSTASFPVKTEEGIVKEWIEQKIAKTYLGNVEVSDCKLYPPAVIGRRDIGLHLKVPPIRGFEAILALSGKATLGFPERVDPIGGLYFGSDKRASVEMIPGTLAIIPAPTASGWTKIEGDVFEFRYISLPPWRPDYVRAVQQ